MESILTTINNWAENIRQTYNVNPYIFGLLYVGCAPFFWFSLYKIVNSIRKGQVEKIVIWAVVLDVATLLPFIYVAIFGKNLPVWFWIIALALVLYSVISLLRNTRSSILQNGEKPNHKKLKQS